ncbi:hypothetical protein DMR_32100 [Solidesulfovibrio magneticus RS-1]|uniref:Uncharacterized protein n=1 Tax=Solidesulfovibrio magneticus (strain ATCC 700980 / DSM 13731 / RS-1) TaxID=573370 RepID=C4XJF1_SOLM1|nr:hypothetical protein DMR_32100 [Solidesulfovibrio magneticus RS-1]
MSFPMNPFPQRADVCARHGASLHPHFQVHFRRISPASPGIPMYQNSMNTTHLAEITDDPRKFCVQIRSKFFNILKIQIKT